MAVRRRITFVTGTRAEYGLMSPVMKAVQAQPKLSLQLIVTGMHLDRRFGYTVKEIARDGWKIDARVGMHQPRETKTAQAQALSKGVAGIAEQLERLRSDIVVVLGDRIEALAGALAASATNRFLAHIHGGDVAPGYLDDRFRHAITKLAHLHFAASRNAAERIKKLGEKPQNIHFVGAPGLDDLKALPAPQKGWLAKRFDLDEDREVALILQHPIGRPSASEYKTMCNLLKAAAGLKLAGVMVYPNNDPGYPGIIKAIRQQIRRGPKNLWAAVESLRREEFLQCLIAARVLIGNSSSGIIEAHTAGTPAVNIGLRQYSRLRSGPSVINSGESIKEIKSAIQKALSPRKNRGRSSVYGTGRAGLKIARILTKTPLSDNIRRKKITY